jgi:hypothetical protein
MTLAEIQRRLASSLAGREDAPAGLDPEEIERARNALESKRRQAAGHLLPRLRTALGTDWSRRFHEHARGYVPTGNLHHVDDAWELAATVLKEGDPELAPAAHDDLLALRLRWVRDPRKEALRIRERQGPLLVMTRTVPRRLILRLPGGKLFHLPPLSAR